MISTHVSGQPRTSFDKVAKQVTSPLNNFQINNYVLIENYYQVYLQTASSHMLT